MANSNKNVVPEARAALDKFKMEAANEVGVNLNNSYKRWHHRSSGWFCRRTDGQERWIEKYENDLKNGTDNLYL